MDVESKRGSFVAPTYFVYKIVHLPTNKIYIGQTNNIDQRIFFYLQNSHGQCLFHQFLKQYPIEQFCFSILKSELTKEEADDQEKHFISFFNTNVDGLNVQAGGTNNFKGMNLELKNQYNHKWTVKFTDKEIVEFIDFLKDTNGLTVDSSKNILIRIDEREKYKYKRFPKSIGARWDNRSICWKIDHDNGAGKELWRQMVKIYKSKKGESIEHVSKRKADKEVRKGRQAASVY